MGKIGKQIVGREVESILEDLNKAAAAELNDAYRYRLLAEMAMGINSRELASWFARTSEDEWKHLRIWLDRICVLGGRPFARPAQAESLAYTPYQDPPEDPADLRAMIEQSLKGERAAIRFYSELFRKTQNADPVTAELARKALADEVSDEDDLERFLAGLGPVEAAEAEEHHAGRRR